jgi:hypothetical protein
MLTGDHFTDSERAALALTGAAPPFGDRAEPAPERIVDEGAGTYGRALAGLIVAIADVVSGPTPTSPPGKWGTRPAERRWEGRHRDGSR